MARSNSVNWDDDAVKPDPAGQPRNPFHVFVLCLALVNGIAFAAGAPTSGSMDEQLHHPLPHVYGAILALSSAAVLAGMYWPWDRRTGILAKRVGYAGLAWATFTFAVATLLLFGWEGVYASSITMSFSLICAWQYRRLHRIVVRDVELSDG